jgi:hypothetical protein
MSFLANAWCFSIDGPLPDQLDAVLHHLSADIHSLRFREDPALPRVPNTSDGVIWRRYPFKDRSPKETHISRHKEAGAHEAHV